MIKSIITTCIPGCLPTSNIHRLLYKSISRNAFKIELNIHKSNGACATTEPTKNKHTAVHQHWHENCLWL